MKSVLALSALLSIVSFSCEVTTNEGVVNPQMDSQIGNVSFTLDTTYMVSSPGMLVAKGTAKNNGTETISSPWYVECSFYTDSTLTVVLGDGDDQIGVPLSQGQSAYWMISLSSANVDVRRFPAFRVGSFRATYKNE